MVWTRAGSLHTNMHRFVPDVTPAHLRYLTLILDMDGDSQVGHRCMR